MEHPTVFYKYKSLAGDGMKHVEDIFRKNAIMFSSPMSFNDPFECGRKYEIGNSRQEVVGRVASYYVKKGVTPESAKIRAEQEVPPSGAELDKWQTSRINALNQSIAKTGILCLAVNPAHPLMWSHYSCGHTGICIQFRPAAIRTHIDFIGPASSVVYSDRMPIINPVLDNPIDWVRRIFFTKPCYFEYEHEWRVLDYKKAGLKELPPQIIGQVILGCRITEDNQRRVIQLCRDYDGDVEILKADLDPDMFGLKFEHVATV